MIIYSFYQTLATLLYSLYNLEIRVALCGALAIAVAFALTLFTLQGFGFYKMAKNRNMKNKALAFVPYANIYYAGKLAGEGNFFGQKIKRVGLYTMLAQIVSSVLSILTIAVEIYLYSKHGAPTTQTQLGIPYWSGLEGLSATLYKFYDLNYYILPIFNLIFRVLLLVLLMSLFKKYSPNNYTFLVVMCFMIPEASYITIFVIRNRKAIDYEAYMREKREAFFRRQQEYHRRYGNPYNPYNNPYGNPYHNPYNQNNQTKSDDEPFAEFASDKKSSNPSSDTNANTQPNNDETSDGFFD